MDLAVAAGAEAGVGRVAGGAPVLGQLDGGVVEERVFSGRVPGVVENARLRDGMA